MSCRLSEIRLIKSPAPLLFLILLLPSLFSPETAAAQTSAAVLKKCWFYPSPHISNLTGASDNESADVAVTVKDKNKDKEKENVYFSLNEKITSIDAKIGEKNWDSDLGGTIVSNLLVFHSSIYAVTNRSVSATDISIKSEKNENGTNEENEKKKSEKISILYAVDKITGLPLWKIELEFAEKVRLAHLPNGILAAGENGDARLINETNGEILWRRNIGMPIEIVSVLQTNRIALGLADGRLVTVSATDGKTVNQFQFPTRIKAVAEDSVTGSLIFGNAKGNLEAFDQKSNRRVWRTRLGAAVSDIAPNREGLLVSSLDNFVYLISAPTGRLIWKRRLSGRIVAPPLIRENFFVVASIDEPNASIISLNDGKLLNRLPLENGDFYTGPAVGAGNSLVFATRLGIAGFSDAVGECPAR